ncbi:hypothetical protein CHOTACABRAS_23 [Bacillus phage Chotacabras]|nr:hypothetical protein CHOTACABRAS_23 [Bacillus phage Chotacabras]
MDNEQMFTKEKANELSQTVLALFKVGIISSAQLADLIDEIDERTEEG